jgi:hypothetical protein
MSQYKRREFLKTTAGATAGAAIVGAPSVHAQAWNNQPEKGAKLRVLRWKRFVQGDEDAYMANVKKFTAKYRHRSARGPRRLGGCSPESGGGGQRRQRAGRDPVDQRRCQSVSRQAGRRHRPL